MGTPKTGSRPDTTTSERNAIAREPASIAPPARTARLRRSDVVRADGRVRRRVYLYLDLELVRRLAQHCAANDVALSDVVVEGIERVLTARDPATDKG